MSPEARSAPVWRLEQRLRRRLGALLFGLWLLGSVAALTAVREETDEVLDAALIETAQHLAALPLAAYASDSRDPATLAPRGPASHEENLVYQVFDRHGTLLLRSHRAPAEPLASDAVGGVSDHGAWRVATLQLAEPGTRVLAAESLAHRREVIWESSLWLLLPLLLVLPLAAWGLHGVLRAAFKTLEPTLAQLGQFETPLHTSGVPAELQPLLLAVNGMRERLLRLLEAERASSANLAHELRTPLAAARAQAQVLEAQLAEASVQMAPVPLESVTRAGGLIQQIDRINRLATRLLQMARIEAGLALQREPVDTAWLAQLIIDELSSQREDARLSLIVSDPPPPIWSADLDALGIALRNLIENALRHGGAQARVEVRVLPGCIEVEDDGPGMSPEALARLQAELDGPHPRASISGGQLGLRLTARIARETGARLELLAPAGAQSGWLARLVLDKPGG